MKPTSVKRSGQVLAQASVVALTRPEEILGRVRTVATKPALALPNDASTGSGVRGCDARNHHERAIRFAKNTLAPRRAVCNHDPVPDKSDLAECHKSNGIC